MTRKWKGSATYRDAPATIHGRDGEVLHVGTYNAITVTFETTAETTGEVLEKLSPNLRAFEESLRLGRGPSDVAISEVREADPADARAAADEAQDQLVSDLIAYEQELWAAGNPTSNEEPQQ